jgi:hypothetical protein
MRQKTTAVHFKIRSAAAVIILITQVHAAEEPARDIKLVEKKWEELSNHDVSSDGQKALNIDPQKWRHAETENFIMHYRRVTEAKKVAREIEYDIWFVANALGASKERYARKSHVYVFEDDDEWNHFLSQSDAPPWAVSFAFGDELFLNVRRAQASGRFDSQTLAHETTHAVVARLYPNQRWPVWLSEGFAEYMGSASVAARKHQTIKRHQQDLHAADMSLSELESLQKYPEDRAAVSRLYQSGEKLVRFLMTELPKAKFPSFVDALLTGQSIQTAVLTVYKDDVKDFARFEQDYKRFLK